MTTDLCDVKNTYIVSAGHSKHYKDHKKDVALMKENSIWTCGAQLFGDKDWPELSQTITEFLTLMFDTIVHSDGCCVCT